MKKINIRVPLTEYDVYDLFREFLESRGSSSIVWSFPAEDDDIDVVIHFVKEDDDIDI